jgi:hypothetical protein
MAILVVQIDSVARLVSHARKGTCRTQNTLMLLQTVGRQHRIGGIDKVIQVKGKEC